MSFESKIENDRLMKSNLTHDEAGYYRTRDGGMVRITLYYPQNPQYCLEDAMGRTWDRNGNFTMNCELPCDLVEYLGKSNPLDKDTTK
jgi:hypothetical protein